MSILKYLGAFILLIGVVILVIPTFTGNRENIYLAIGLVTILIGFFGHIFLNRKFE